MHQPTLLLDIVPVQEEDEDFVATTTDNELLAATQEALKAQGYIVTSFNDGQRGDVLQVVIALAEQAQTQAPALAALITAAITTLSTLSKHRRIGEIELSRGSEKLVIKDADRATVERLAQRFAERTAASPDHPRMTARTTKRR